MYKATINGIAIACEDAASFAAAVAALTGNVKTGKASTARLVKAKPTAEEREAARVVLPLQLADAIIRDHDANAKDMRGGFIASRIYLAAHGRQDAMRAQEATIAKLAAIYGIQL